MKNMFRLFVGTAMLSVMIFAHKPVRDERLFVKENFTCASEQIDQMLRETEWKKLSYPRTTRNGKMVGTNMYDWTSGFFPGYLWYAYEYNKDTALAAAARRWTESLEPLKTFTQHHDIGFMMYCSYGNAYRLTGNPAYRDILIQSAKSLITRYNPVTGCIQSWKVFYSWNDSAKYDFPVIIDNMMNLELLFFASKITGDDRYKKVAVSHALHTMKYQIRPDYSSYHVVCYDTATGKVLARETAQGYADNSTWARGQAWGIYGFTMAYRETGDKRFLKTAQGMADWYISNKNLPADRIPYWDFNTGMPGYTPGKRSNAWKVKENFRDASAAAVTASALLELSTFSGAKGAKYKDMAVDMLHSLASPAYRAPVGDNGNFLLMHSVGSIPHDAEIDVPLVYADYYFLEALQRYKKMM